MSIFKGNALVIGANRGIGLALLEELQRRGWAVWGTYRPETSDDESVHELISTGAYTFEINLTDEASIKAAAEQWGDKPLDILVNCAAVGIHPKLWQETTAEVLMEKFQVNVVGPFLTTKYFYPALLRSQQGKVINVTSDLASITENDGRFLAYRVSKAGLNQVTKTIAMEQELNDSKVTINGIHPGWIPTALSDFIGTDDIDEQVTLMANTIEGFGPEDNGRYVDADGKDHAL